MTEQIKMTRPLVLLLLAMNLMASPVLGQELTRILFILDASNSMNGRWQSESKMQVATRLLEESLEELKGSPDLELALRVYGHGSSIASAVQDCDDTELIVPFGSYRYSQIKESLIDIQPQGTTPIARSLERAAEDFPDGNSRNVIILITDGIEACDEDPCAASLALQRKNITLKPFVIGIGLEGMDTAPFECIGNFFDASSEESFKNVLNIVIGQALNNTTVQVDLLDSKGKAQVSNVPLTFLDSRNGQELYHFVHTMNQEQRPDTLPIDPSYTYDVIAHTVPPVRVTNQKIKAGSHSHIPIHTPISRLRLRMSGSNAYEQVPCLIRRNGESGLLHVQDMESEQNYLEGQYNLEILTRPRMKFESLRLIEGELEEIIIPSPGVLNLSLPSRGYGAVFSVNGAESTWVYDLNEMESRQRIVLQPGDYRVVYRSRNSKQSIYTIEKEFSIKSESSVQLNL